MSDEDFGPERCRCGRRAYFAEECYACAHGMPPEPTIVDPGEGRGAVNTGWATGIPTPSQLTREARSANHCINAETGSQSGRPSPESTIHDGRIDTAAYLRRFADYAAPVGSVLRTYLLQDAEEHERRAR